MGEASYIPILFVFVYVSNTVTRMSDDSNILFMKVLLYTNNQENIEYKGNSKDGISNNLNLGLV